MNKLSESLWNCKGEISREKFTKIFVSIIFLLSVVLFFTSKFNILGITKLTIFIAFIFISIQCIKRLHDLNLKAWFHFFFNCSIYKYSLFFSLACCSWN